MVRIQITGIESAISQIGKDYQAFLTELTEQTLAAAKRNTPVRTGQARDGWEAKVAVVDNFRQSSGKVEVTNKVPYVTYLDKGTRKMKPANNGKGIVGPTLTEIKGKK